MQLFSERSLLRFARNLPEEPFQILHVSCKRAYHCRVISLFTTERVAEPLHSIFVDFERHRLLHEGLDLEVSEIRWNLVPAFSNRSPIIAPQSPANEPALENRTPALLPPAHAGRTLSLFPRLKSRRRTARLRRGAKQLPTLPKPRFPLSRW